jgi:hypothetical protein
MKPAKKSLFTALGKCQDEIANKVKNPNYGGCGVIAAIVASELQSLGIPAEVVTTTKYGDVPRKVMQRVLTKNKPITNSAVDSEGIERDHLGVRFKLGNLIRTWDSDGLNKGRLLGYLNEPCNYKFGEGLTVEEATMLANDKHGWNSMFNRRQIPKIRKIVKEAFKDLK